MIYLTYITYFVKLNWQILNIYLYKLNFGDINE